MIDQWIKRFSNISQIGLLCLGIFGYFYTVVPVYQNQRLQEQTAKLEVEKSTLEKSLASYTDEREQIKNDINILKNERDKEKKYNQQLSQENQQLKDQVKLTRVETEEAQKILLKEQSKLDYVRWKYILNSLSTENTFGILKTFNSRSDETNSDSVFIEKEKTWYDFYDHAIYLLEHKEKLHKENNNMLPQQYYDEIKLFFQTKVSFFKCEKPNFQALNDNYLKECNAIEPEVQTELQTRLNLEVEEERKNGRQLIITDDYRQAVEKSIRGNKIFQIYNKYHAIFWDSEMKCQRKFYDALKEFEKIKNINH